MAAAPEPELLPRVPGPELLVQRSIAHNAGVVAHVGVIGSLVAGLLAGLWNVTGWQGFLYYFGLQAVVTGLLYVKTGGDVKRYFVSRWSVFFGEALSSTLLLTFILFWTLSQNFVHLF